MWCFCCFKVLNWYLYIYYDLNFYIFLYFKMPVKKTFKKTTTKTSFAKKPVAKKSPAKKASTVKRTVVKKPSVIVETKKTNPTSKPAASSCNKVVRVFVFVLLILNLAFGILNLIKKDGAMQLEELKVWGSENMTKVIQLYNSETYKSQQAAAIQQFMMWQ